ncbi:mitochondrial matrix iron-sulfur protein [Thelotrema lepadinum]|nr:mitochondrial matrix iron-sulfur protein [Thelotrema lepadinum]
MRQAQHHSRGVFLQLLLRADPFTNPDLIYTAILHRQDRAKSEVFRTEILVPMTIIDQDSQPHKYTVAPDDNLLDIAQANDLEMEGACGGSCACSTCHVIVDDPQYYDKMPEPEDDENDMLDLAFGLTETSRLGCQVKMSKELDGLVVKLPAMTRNLQESDFKKKEKGN